MAKGTIAKDNVIKKIAAAFGADYVGVDDKKKIYVWSEENGERVQVALALTCPKTPISIGAVETTTEDEDFPDVPTDSVPMGEDEKATFDRLARELGL